MTVHKHKVTAVGRMH